jgi:hypothetical protein
MIAVWRVVIEDELESWSLGRCRWRELRRVWSFGEDGTAGGSVRLLA